jgi:hypothetical protein
MDSYLIKELFRQDLQDLFLILLKNYLDRIYRIFFQAFLRKARKFQSPSAKKNPVNPVNPVQESFYKNKNPFH